MEFLPGSLVNGLSSITTAPGGSPGTSGSVTTPGGETEPTTAGTGNLIESIGTAVTDVVSGILDSIGGNDRSNYDVAKNFGDVSSYWLEKVANYSPWNDVFSMEQQETSLTIDIPFDNRYYFVPACLGFAYVEGGRIKRINPIRHPYWSWMRAARVAHVGVRYEGTKAFFSEAGVSSKVGVARYRLARFTVAFANYPWEFLEDDEIETAGDEWRRNVYWEEEPTAQMLAAEGGSSTLKYAYDTSSLGGPSGDANFRAQIGTPVGQIRYILNWKWVPYDYVYFNRIPTNLYNAIMKLNSTEAFAENGVGTGFPAGTLLFDPPQIAKYVYPIRTRDRVAMFCDIKIPMTYMNPPRGVTSETFQNEARISRQRGHNLAPHRENNLWYPAVRSRALRSFDSDGNLTPGLFRHHDWTKLFQKPTASE